MKMTIREFWPQDMAFDGTVIPPREGQPCTFDESGWLSVAEMQKELMRRFPRQQPEKIEGGIKYNCLSYGRTQTVTLHD